MDNIKTIASQVINNSGNNLESTVGSIKGLTTSTSITENGYVMDAKTIVSQLNAKQNSSTAITTSNIGSQSVNYANNAGAVNGYAINYSQGNGTVGPASYAPSGNAYWHKFGKIVILFCYDLVITPYTNNNSTVVSNLPASNKYFGTQVTNGKGTTIRLGMETNSTELKVWWNTVETTSNESWSFQIIYMSN